MSGENHVTVRGDFSVGFSAANFLSHGATKNGLAGLVHGLKPIFKC